jgi:mRNA-degrading endonuclease toxin of MazEF toxin-antitoxin module
MMVVGSRADTAAPRALSICAPITTANRGSAYEVELPSRPFLRERSYANIQGLQAIQHHELQGPIGIFHGKIMEQIREAIAYTFDITPPGEQGGGGKRE